MKVYVNYLLILVAALSMTACKQSNKPIEGLQGKVKHEVISVAPKVPGRVMKLLVSEGQVVKKGDTLAILDAPEISAKVEQADGAVEAANWQLDMARNGATAEQLLQIAGQVDAVKEQVSFAEKSYQRMSNMYKDSLIPAQLYDEVKTKYESAKAQLKALEAKQLEVEKGSRKEQLGMAKGQLDRAVAVRKEAAIAMQERYLLAPADMRIETISLSVGELALPGYTLISGYENQTTYFRFTVTESMVNAFKIGQQVTVEVPFINKSINATIKAVKEMPRYADNTSVAPAYQLGETMFELKVVPDNITTTAELFHNSTVLLKER